MYKFIDILSLFFCFLPKWDELNLLGYKQMLSENRLITIFDVNLIIFVV